MEAPLPEIEDEVTPAHLRCTIGSCPAVFQLSDGDLLIVGKALTPELQRQIEARVGSDELAIKLSPEFFRSLFK
jgi:hypothetical protein